MPSRPRSRWLPSVVLVAAAIAAACAPAAPTQPTGSRPPGNGGKASPKPSGAPGSSAPDAPSAAPGSVAPGSVAPSAPGSVAPSAAGGSPAAVPPGGVLRDAVANKLLNLAKVNFNQARSLLASTGDVAKASLLGNNSAGVISNNAGNLLSDKGLGLVANNGGGLISDGGGGLVANNGGGLTSKTKYARPFGLLQATALPTLPPVPEIATTAQAGETLTQRRVYPDGTIGLRFTGFSASDPEAYRLVHVRDGKPIREYANEATAFWPNGKDRTSRTATREIHGGGALAVNLLTENDFDETGKLTRVRVLPPTYLRDGASGAGNQIEQLDMDYAGLAGSFRFVQAALGSVETGTFKVVQGLGTGRVPVPYTDPLSIYDGSATMKVGDATVFTRSATVSDGDRITTYDLNDGIGLVLARPATVVPGESPTLAGFEGRLTRDGAKIARVAFEVAPEGTATFTVTFDDDPARPLVVGFGATGEEPLPIALPKLEPTVTTILGLSGSGFLDGPGPLAKFRTAGDLAASPKAPGTIFLADQLNQRIRKLDLATQAVTTFAGDGTEGYQDGPAAKARFTAPSSVGVGADDTVYVGDGSAAPRIRAIAPDGTVSTLCGTGVTRGAIKDGVGTEAQFSSAVGFAFAEDGGIYFADYYNAAIRRVGTRGPDLGVVTTIAGTGTAGFAEGPGKAAQFNGPIATALGPDGALYVADTVNRRIRRIDLADPAHPVTTIVGTDDPARRGMDGAALETGLEPPRDLLFDAAGRLVFLSLIDVRRLDPDGQVRTLAGNGLDRHSDGQARSASFGAGNALLLGPEGLLFIGHAAKVSILTEPPKP